MAPDLQAHDRIYRVLRDDLARGQYPPGMRIEILRVAERNRSSATPVREVLTRLVGEGLVEMQVHGGFGVARLDAARLAHLYRWNAMILKGILPLIDQADLRQPFPQWLLSSRASTASDAAAYISGLFLVLAQALDNAETERAIDASNARLSFVRIAEFAVIRNARQEIAGFQEALRAHDLTGLRRRIAAYHLRRLEHVAQIVDTLPRWMI